MRVLGLRPRVARESPFTRTPKEQPPPESLRQMDRAGPDSLESVRAATRAAEGVTRPRLGERGESSQVSVTEGGSDMGLPVGALVRAVPWERDR